MLLKIGHRQYRLLSTTGPALSKAGNSNTHRALTHVDQSGRAQMVAIDQKQDTHRIATSKAYLQTTRQAIKMIQENALAKGDVLAVARVAGIMASKQTSQLIPLCHNINLSKVAVDLLLDEMTNRIRIEATAECVGRTGVEMEALTACSVAGLTLYDMLKAVDKNMVICDLRVTSKTGGKSGD